MSGSVVNIMTVTRIEAMDKKRVRIFIDYEFAFVLYKGELRLYKLAEGHEIDESVHKEIVSVLLPKRAKLRCMNLLKARSYTEQQLKDKLKRGEYTAALIDEALEYVKSYGYVDDRRYTEDFIEYNMNIKSRKRIEQDLLKKGVDKKTVSEVFDKIKENGMAADEVSMAGNLLRKKKYDANTASFEEKRKLSAFLYRKGFGADIIRRVLLLDITSN